MRKNRQFTLGVFVLAITVADLTTFLAAQILPGGKTPFLHGKSE